METNEPAPGGLPPDTAAAAAEPAAAAGRFSLGNVLRLLAPALGLLAVVGAVGYRAIQSPPIDYTRRLTSSLRDQKLATRLSGAFTDADKDGLADPPADPAQHLDPAELVFCDIPTDDPAKDAALWKPFADHLAKATGMKVRYETAIDRADLPKAVAEGRLHLTALNTGSVPYAVNALGFVPLAVIGNAKGEAGINSLLIAPARSKIEAPPDLRGGRVQFTDIASNTGFKAPLVLLREKFSLQAGLETDYDFRFTGGHRESIRAVRDWQRRPSNAQVPADDRPFAAAVTSDLLDEAVAAGIVDKADFREVFRSDPFPPKAFGVSHRLSPALVAKVRQALLDFPFAGSGLDAKYLPGKSPRFLPANYKERWSFVIYIDEAMQRLRGS